ncbi:MAG: cyclase family protein [Deltaproteobacteria bacterium]|nr:cyclase family protein [Deltaproteobacteria bacterium]
MKTIATLFVFMLALSPRMGITQNKIDLTHPIREGIPVWPGSKPVQIEKLAGMEKDHYFSQHLSFPEHTGTHIDAPAHFSKNGKTVDQLTPEELNTPAYLIDVQKQVSSNPDYTLTVADLQSWELEHGKTVRGGIVLLRTGWDRYWSNPKKYLGQDAQGKLHFPGFSCEVAEYLFVQYDVRGLGIDTPSIDAGLASDFCVHRFLLGKGKFFLENLKGLSRLPTRSTLEIAPLLIEGGSGSPARVFATPQG